MKKPKKEEKPLSGAQDAYEWLQILIVALVTIILYSPSWGASPRWWGSPCCPPSTRGM